MPFVGGLVPTLPEPNRTGLSKSDSDSLRLAEIFRGMGYQPGLIHTLTGVTYDPFSQQPMLERPLPQRKGALDSFADKTWQGPLSQIADTSALARYEPHLPDANIIGVNAPQQPGLFGTTTKSPEYTYPSIQVNSSKSGDMQSASVQHEAQHWLDMMAPGYTWYQGLLDNGAGGSFGDYASSSSEQRARRSQIRSDYTADQMRASYPWNMVERFQEPK